MQVPCRIRWLAAHALLAAALALPAAARASEQARVIVAFKPEAEVLRARALAAAAPAGAVRTEAQRRADALAAPAGRTLSAGRLFGIRSMVVRAQGIGSAALAARLATHADVAYAIPDLRRRAHRIPNDPLYLSGPTGGAGPEVGQWYLRAPDDTLRSAVNAQAAWDLVRPGPELVVAVLDTGVLATHPDLAGRVLPGHDLIDDLDTANDGDGRDGDASDPGDWITAAEDSDFRSPFFDCGAASSSWHGTQVAGVIGATADNGIGMAGAAHGVSILPVRVLGKCGGFISDIVAGMYWAAGIDQEGLPGSRTPARVLNLSLGSSEPCTLTEQEAVTAIGASPRHAVVVAAAGNGTGHQVGAPAACQGVIAVAGLRHTGSKVGFSDLGPEVTIAAPGGNCVNIGAGQPCLYPILTTSNRGGQRPDPAGSTWTDSFEFSVGTSFSTPIVSATAALVLTARPDYTAREVFDTLQRTARPFPTTGSEDVSGEPVPQCRAPDGTDQLQCYCTTGLCGAGMLDTAAAVLDAVQRVPLPDAARQLMDFAESRYPSLFPGPRPTQSVGPFVYRFYPSTGIYLGVVIRSDAHYGLNDVYAQGGVFGSQPVRGGRLDDFIVPQPKSSR